MSRGEIPLTGYMMLAHVLSLIKRNCLTSPNFLEARGLSLSKVAISALVVSLGLQGGQRFCPHRAG